MLTEMTLRGVSSEERLAAVERAIQVDRRLMESWDRKAELLAAAERFDEAIAICDAGAAQVDADRHVLGGRAAWVEAQRRRFEQAIARMRSILAENAGYLWGWRQLTSWLQETGDIAGAAEALEAMRRLRPHDGWVARELGFLKLRQEDRPSAEKAFRDALDAAPEDIAAAHNLLELELGRGDLPAAARTLGIMQVHQPGTATLAAAITLRLREADPQGALEYLRALAMSPDPDPWPFSRAVDAFKEDSHCGSALRILRRGVREGRNPECAPSVVRLLCARRRFFAAAFFYLRLEPGEARQRTTAPLLQLLAPNGKNLLISLLSRMRHDALREDDAAWAYVGYALMERRKMKSMVRWMADWEKRPDVQPWMLFNYCVALRCIGREEDAHRIATHVLQNMHYRDGAGYLQVLLAVELALRREPAAASVHLELAEKEKSTGYDTQMIAIARSLVRLLESPP